MTVDIDNDGWLRVQLIDIDKLTRINRQIKNNDDNSVYATHLWLDTTSMVSFY